MFLLCDIATQFMNYEENEIIMSRRNLLYHALLKGDVLLMFEGGGTVGGSIFVFKIPLIVYISSVHVFYCIINLNKIFSNYFRNSKNILLPPPLIS